MEHGTLLRNVSLHLPATPEGCISLIDSVDMIKFENEV